MNTNSETKDRIIQFYSRQEAWREFSNFYPAIIEVEGKYFYSTEAYYQSCKFPDFPEYAEKIQLERSAVKVKQMSTKKACTNAGVKMRADWNKIKDQIMMIAITAKFTQHPNLKRVLLSTKNSPLAEHTVNDTYWADGGETIDPITCQSSKGKNVLGRLLMDLRKQLREEDSKKSSSSVEIDNSKKRLKSYLFDE